MLQKLLLKYVLHYSHLPRNSVQNRYKFQEDKMMINYFFDLAPMLYYTHMQWHPKCVLVEKRKLFMSIHLFIIQGVPELIDKYNNFYSNCYIFTFFFYINFIILHYNSNVLKYFSYFWISKFKILFYSFMKKSKWPFVNLIF